MAASSDAAGVVEAAGAGRGSPAKSGGQLIPAAKDKERRTTRRWRRTIIGRNRGQRLASTRPDGHGKRHVHSRKAGRPSGKTSKTATKTIDNELSRRARPPNRNRFAAANSKGSSIPFRDSRPAHRRATPRLIRAGHREEPLERASFSRLGLSFLNFEWPPLFYPAKGVALRDRISNGDFRTRRLGGRPVRLPSLRLRDRSRCAGGECHR